MRKRKIVKVGGSFDIRLTSGDIIDFELKENDFVDISEIRKLKEDKK